MKKRFTDLADVMYILNDYVVLKIAFVGFTCPSTLLQITELDKMCAVDQWILNCKAVEKIGTVKPYSLPH